MLICCQVHPLLLVVILLMVSDALLFYKKKKEITVSLFWKAMLFGWEGSQEAPSSGSCSQQACVRSINISSFLSPLCPYLEERRKAPSSCLLPTPTDAAIGGVSRIYVVNSSKWNTAFKADPSALPSRSLHVYSVVSQRKAAFSSDWFFFAFFQIYFLGILKIWIYIMEALLRIQRLQAFYDLIFLRGIFFCCHCWCESIYGPWTPSSGGKASSSLLVTVSSLAKFTRKNYFEISCRSFSCPICGEIRKC